MPEKSFTVLDKLLDCLGLARKSRMDMSLHDRMGGNIPFGVTILQGQAAEIRMDIRHLIKEYARELQLKMRELLLNPRKINDFPIPKQERDDLLKSLNDLNKMLPNGVIRDSEIPTEYAAKLDVFITQVLKIPEFQQIVDKYIDAARDIPAIFNADDLPYIPVKYTQGLQGHMEESALDDLNETLGREIVSTLDYTRATCSEVQVSFRGPALENEGPELKNEVPELEEEPAP